MLRRTPVLLMGARWFYFDDKRHLETQEVIDLIFPPQSGSTDWMDGIRTIEDVKTKNKLVVWCSACDNWFHFERDPQSTHMIATYGQVCDCGSSTGFIGSTIISERTWTPDKKPPKKSTSKKRR